MYIFMSVNMYATRRCTHGVPTVYPYPQYPWLTQPEGRRVRVLTGMGTGQPGITRGLPVLIPTHASLANVKLATYTNILSATLSLIIDSASRSFLRHPD